MTRSSRAGRARAIVTAFCAGVLAMFVVAWALWGTRVAALGDDCGDPTDIVRSDDAAETASDPPPVVRTAPPAPPPSPSLAPVIDAAGALPDLRGRALTVPVRGVDVDDLVRSFEDERSGGRRHEAMDILAPRHTPVLAVEDGTIARLFESKAGGLTIYQFDPTSTYTYYYAHLQNYAQGLTAGDPVRRGQVIGYVGTTGNAPPDTPHLHFAIYRLTDAKRWWEGAPIDPFDVWR